MRYRFLEFVLDTDQHALLRTQAAIPLRRQSFRVLTHLVERAPAVVAKDELLDAVWGHHAVSASVVAQTIRELRDALGDDAEQPRAILTKHRFGYQFIAAVERDDDGTPPPLPHAGANEAIAPPVSFGRSSRPARHWLRIGWPWLIAALALLAAIVSMNRASAPTERGWPADAAAWRDVQQALAAARRFEIAQAVQATARARARADTPRLALFEARLRLAMGEHDRARRVLAAFDAERGRLARRDQLILDAVGHELDGRYGDALDRSRIVFEMDTADADAGLVLFELQHHENDAGLSSTYERLAVLDEVPSPRRLLLSAQLAGQQDRIEVQATQARAVLATTQVSPALAALARLERARAWRGMGRIDEARAEFERAAAALEKEGLLRVAAEARLDQADPALAQGDLTTVAEQMAMLERRFGAAGDAYMHGRILHARGRIAARAGRDEEAIGLFAAAIQQHESARNWDGVASALSAQSGPLRRLARGAEARAVLERALSFAEQSGSAAVQAGVHGNLANLYAAESRYDEAVRHFEAALPLFRRVHDRRQEAVTLGNLSNLAALTGDARRADDLNRQALAIFRALDMTPDVARILLNLASAALVRGDLDDAQALAEESVDLYRRLPHSSRTARALALLADLKLHAADLTAATALLEEAGAQGELDAPTAAIVATVEGWIARLRGDADAAQAAFERALRSRESIGERSLTRASRLDLARLALDRGQPAAAEQAALTVAAEAKTDASPADERDARLMLIEAQLEQNRTADAERELTTARTLLDQAPQFDGEMQWALLRARLDRDPHNRRERLLWVQAQAERRGQRLLALRVHGELLAFEPPGAAVAWQDEIERLGLVALAGPRVTIRP